MKYIARYAPKAVDTEKAADAHENEYYRTPHGAGNGKSLGKFVETEYGVREFIYLDGAVRKIEEEWLERVASDLFAYLKANTNFDGLQGINSFSMSNCLPREALGVEKNHGFQYLLQIGAGYTAYISQDGERVLAEAYIACSGNAVVVIHYEDESILYVNSRRHGIPSLAFSYVGEEPHEVVMYDSWRTDVRWHEAGLFPPEDWWRQYVPASDEGINTPFANVFTHKKG